MSYLQYIRKGVKEVSEVPKQIAPAITEGVADNEEVVSQPPVDPMQPEVIAEVPSNSVEITGVTKKNKLPPSGSIAGRVKRTRATGPKVNASEKKDEIPVETVEKTRKTSASKDKNSKDQGMSDCIWAFVCVLLFMSVLCLYR
jgi:hypothetical protein